MNGLPSFWLKMLLQELHTFAAVLALCLMSSQQQLVECMKEPA